MSANQVRADKQIAEANINKNILICIFKTNPNLRYDDSKFWSRISFSYFNNILF